MMVQPPEIDISTIGPDGYALETGTTVWVWAWGKQGAFPKDKGNEELPFRDDVGRVLHVRAFQNKPIYFDLELARSEILDTTNVLVIGATGYTNIAPETCLAWGFQPGAYEAAAERLLVEIIEGFSTHFPDSSIRIVEGAVQLGIDSAMINVAESLAIPHLGFSCPAFAPYLDDDAMPIFLAHSQKEYSDAFVKSLDVLLGMNGRQQAFEHDMSAAMKYRKRLILVSILEAISTTGGPPAYNADGSINDALAAFMLSVSSLSRKPSETYDELMSRVVTEVIDRGRSILPPKQAYHWKK